MMATMHLRNRAVAVCLVTAVVLLAGCAYSLPPINPASQERIHIVASAPEQYVVQVNMETVKQYDVPHDGRIEIAIPPYRPSCAVHLFGVIKVRGYGDPLNSWIVSITRNGKMVRKESLRATLKSPRDEAGYHIVKITE